MLAPLPGPAEDRPLHVEELEVDAAMVTDGRTRRFLIACGLPHARIEQALGEARGVVARAGSAVIEVHLAEAPADVRVGAAAAVTLPATGDPRASDITAATG
jgi:hypothetical protein